MNTPIALLLAGLLTLAQEALASNDPEVAHAALSVEALVDSGDEYLGETVTAHGILELGAGRVFSPVDTTPESVVPAYFWISDGFDDLRMHTAIENAGCDGKHVAVTGELARYMQPPENHLVYRITRIETYGAYPVSCFEARTSDYAGAYEGYSDGTDWEHAIRTIPRARSAGSR